VDDALRRTRRNMIGASVVLFLVYLVNGQFPSQLKVFNYDIPLSATAFEWLAWFFLTYMCVEYVIHLKSKFPSIRDLYRSHLVRLLSPYVEKNLSDKDRTRIADFATKQQSEYKFKKMNVEFRDSLPGTLHILSKPVFTLGPDRRQTTTPSIKIVSNIDHSKIRSSRFRAAVRVAITEGVGFEYILPAIYPCAALALLVYRKADLLLALFYTN